jgi:DNA-binding transcriptional ArsR family regulator
MRKPENLSRIFQVLSVDTRLLILKLLGKKALCVNAIASRLGMTPAAISQHLRIMKDAGILTAEKRGYYVHYRIASSTLTKWKKAIGAFFKN